MSGGSCGLGWCRRDVAPTYCPLHPIQPIKSSWNAPRNPKFPLLSPKPGKIKAISGGKWIIPVVVAVEVAVGVCVLFRGSLEGIVLTKNALTWYQWTTYLRLLCRAGRLLKSLLPKVRVAHMITQSRGVLTHALIWKPDDLWKPLNKSESQSKKSNQKNKPTTRPKEPPPAWHSASRWWDFVTTSARPRAARATRRWWSRRVGWYPRERSPRELGSKNWEVLPRENQWTEWTSKGFHVFS